MTEENKVKAWFMNRSAWCIGACPTSLQPYSVDLKDSGERKIHPVGRAGPILCGKEYMGYGQWHERKRLDGQRQKCME